MDPYGIIKNLEDRLQGELPGWEAHKLVLPIERLTKYDPYNFKGRESAVSIILHPNGHKLETIFIQRSLYEGSHSGQMAFPGGKRESIDDTLEATARRECNEEIGIPQEHGRSLGQLTEVYIPVSNYVVFPYLFHVDNIPELIIDPTEVHDTVRFDLIELLDDHVVKKTDLQLGNGVKRKNVPYFDVNGRVVWGATALMLAELRSLILDTRKPL